MFLNCISDPLDGRFNRTPRVQNVCGNFHNPIHSAESGCALPAVPPVRTFFVSEALSRSRWYDDASDAGLLFDRCRIVEFCDSIGTNVLERMKNWTAAAAHLPG